MMAMAKGLTRTTGVLLALLLWGTVRAGTVTYVYSDPQGTPLAEADANGNIIATFDYRPYGAQALGTPPAGPGYTGHVNDPDTGLVYMQARYFDPEVGRFLSVDPIGPTAGDGYNFNRFSYANDNPVNNLDKDGRVVISTNAANNAEIARLINSRALGSFKFGSNNVLTMTSAKGDASKYSSYYQDKLLQAINSKDAVTINIAKKVETKTFGTIDVNKDSGGGTTLGSHEGGTQAVTISGDANSSLKSIDGSPLRDDPADILSHELVGHAIPHIVGPDTGNAVKDENKVRAQVPGSGIRDPEPKHIE